MWAVLIFSFVISCNVTAVGSSHQAINFPFSLITRYTKLKNVEKLRKFIFTVFRRGAILHLEKFPTAIAAQWSRSTNFSRSTNIFCFPASLSFFWPLNRYVFIALWTANNIRLCTMWKAFFLVCGNLIYMYYSTNNALFSLPFPNNINLYRL